jgi:hypothetical protein
MVCKRCGGDSFHLKGLYDRCHCCQNIQRSNGTTIKALKEKLILAEGKELRDLNFLLGAKR